MREYFGLSDRTFTSSLFRLAIPMMLQQMVASSISLVDNMMIGGLGDNALAALLQATQVSFLMFVFMFGISSTTQAFTAQFWGQQDLKNIRITQGFAIVCGQVIGWGFFLASFFAPSFILSLFTKDAAVHALGVEYLRIVCFTYPMIGMSYAYAAVLRGTENVRLPMMTSIIGLCCNGVLNYLLIYGHLGLPRLGVSGAAIATVIAQAVDLGLMVLLSHVWKKPTAHREFPLFRFTKQFIKRFGSMAVPIFMNESLWSLAQATVVLLYSWLGTHMAAAMGVFNTFDRLGFIAYVGIGNACAVICGKCIGSGEEDKAQLYAHRILRLAPLFGVVSGVVVFLLMPLLLSFYELSDVARNIVVHNVFVYMLLSPIMVINYAVVVGVLRSGGDARYSLVLDAGLQWVLIVTGVAISAFVLHVPHHWVYAFVAPGEITKYLLGRRRVLSRQWIHNLTT